ncbi:uncharacterized protein BDV17DRAFT_100695 [Aspergillus undulatus]|uniref:uncharacterized protein n=1 Tax=Aspergillus undulatus TaxID=1810928 RepID=UPI003CCE293A
MGVIWLDFFNFSSVSRFLFSHRASKGVLYLFFFSFLFLSFLSCTVLLFSLSRVARFLGRNLQGSVALSDNLSPDI